jgi:molecular chaperone DnaK (HSP70)
LAQNIIPTEYAVNPDEAVALGAAVQAGVLEGVLGGGEVLDVWQAALMRALAEKQVGAFYIMFCSKVLLEIIMIITYVVFTSVLIRNNISIPRK